VRRGSPGALLLDVGLGAALAAAVLAMAGALLTAHVEGGSMLPTLRDGDVLLVDKVGVHVHPPARGDIVIVLQPDGVAAVKRVIGLPGDTLAIDGAHRDADLDLPHPAVLVRPAARGDWFHLREPYVETAWIRPDFCCDDGGRDAGQEPRPVTLGPEDYFVLGDNRNVSIDSRSFGLVTRDRIVARAVVRYWPASRAGSLGQRPTLAPG
jgi:signal peptidase I